MHLHGLGDIVQHQRFHRFFAVFEEALLVLDDMGGHFQQGLVAAHAGFS